LGIRNLELVAFYSSFAIDHSRFNSIRVRRKRSSIELL
jgi:hypothetical protein